MENKKIKQIISTLQTMAKELDEETNTSEIAEQPQATEAVAESTAEAASVTPYSDASDADAEHCYKTFELPDNITVQTDLLKKTTVATFDYFNGATPPAGFCVKHVYNRNSGSSMFGFGFRLNISETLTESGYTDCFGDTYKNIDGYINGMYLSTAYPYFAKNVNKFFDELYLWYGEEGYLQSPVIWLYNGTVAKGFNIYGNLVFICDTQTNYVHIVYNSSGKIEKIEQGSNYITNPAVYDFGYSGNYLSYIKDKSGNRVNFEYDYQEKLSTITYPDGKVLTLDYFGGLMTIYSSDKYIHRLQSHAASATVITRPLTEVNGTTEIVNAPLLEWKISFNDTVTVMDIDGNCEYYKFLQNGKISEYYKGIYKKRKEEEILNEIKEDNAIVTYAEKRSYSKYGEKNFEYITTYIAPDDKLYKTPYSSFNYSIDYSFDEYKRICCNEYKYPILEGASNKRVGQDAYMSYTKTNTYNAKSLVENETTDYCFFTLDDGEKIDEKYYTQIVDYEYNDNAQLIKRISYFEEAKATKGEDVEEYVYNDEGQLLMVLRYNSVWPNKVFINEKTYDDYGRVATETDSTGLSTQTYIYNNYVYKPHGIVLPDNNTEYHYFDTRYRTNEVKLNDGSVSGVNSVTYSGDEAVKYSDGNDGNNEIDFEYDKEKQLSKVKVNNSVLYTISYDLRDDNGNLNDDLKTTVTNAEGNTFTCEEDKAGTYTEIKYGNHTDLKTTYLNNKLTDIVTDGVSGETVKYRYDDANKLEMYRVNEKDGEKYKAYFYYDEFGNVYNITQSGATNISYGYYYENGCEGRLKKIRVSGMPLAMDIELNTDFLGRNTGRKVTYGSNQILSESIEYTQTDLVTLTIKEDEERKVYKQSNLPFRIIYGNGNGYNSYTYDNVGNIKRIINVDGMEITYKYDEANRLTEENNQPLNRKYIFTYDKYGNITTKTEYYYNSDTQISSHEYKYACGKLTKFGTETISDYDALGNPTTYRGNILSWARGKRLSRFKKTTFGYDGRGRRIYKNNTRYFYDYNDRLIASYNDSDGSEKVEYFYDHIGVAGFKYGGSLYYYRRDAQNNVIAILDNNGNTVVKYTYDAWGNHTVSGSNTTLGNLNPFRYRSYFYDTETKLYYLKTRYYDPEVGRFINMDSVQYADPETVNGLNLYAYCGNNPVMNVDPTGEFFLLSLLIGIGIGAALGGVTGGAIAAKKGQNFWGGFLSGALVGGALGAATILGGATALAIGGKAVSGFVAATTFAGKAALLATSVGITALTTFAAGVGSYAIETSFNNEEFHWNDAIREGANTMLKGIAAFGTGMALASGGAYNFLLKGAPKRTFLKMMSDGLRNGIVGGVIKIADFPWIFGL